MEKLEQVKHALSHSIPSGSAEELIEAAFDALLEREARRKGLLVKNPRPRAASASSASVETPSSPETATDASPLRSIDRSPGRREAVPAQVRRDVILRDGAKCQAKLHDGTICGSRVRIEFDHVRPQSLGGASTQENGRILCSAHNQLSARSIFGESIMDLFSGTPRR